MAFIKTGRFWSVTLGNNLKLTNNASFTPPAIRHVRQEFAGGGMTGKVNPSLGLVELMEAPLKFSDYDRDAARLAGFSAGMTTPILLRREFHEPRTGTSSVEMFSMLAQGDVEFSEWERSTGGDMTVTLHIFSARWLKGTEQIYHIDPELGIWEGEGVSLVRQAMQLIGAS